MRDQLGDLIPHSSSKYNFLCNIAAPPSTPNITSLISTYSDQLTVTWTSVPTATSYNVNINDSANTKSSTGAQQYTFTGLTNNTVYTVSVVAINNCAESSSPATISNRTCKCASMHVLLTTPLHYIELWKYCTFFVVAKVSKVTINTTSFQLKNNLFAIKMVFMIDTFAQQLDDILKTHKID